MNDQNQFATAQKNLTEAKKILVLLPPEPTEDQVVGALSLHQSLEHANKESQIGCPSQIHVNSKIQGVEKISDTVGSRNLIISFDYKEDYLDKVDYDVREDGKFYLVIKPKESAPIPDVSCAKFSYSGAEADLVVVIGVNSLEELGAIYSEEKTFLDEANILSLNISPRPSSFTDNQLHLFIPSYAELVSMLLEKAGITPSQDAANNLIFGIFESTQSLSSSKITADTFSSLSFLMKSGGHLPNQQAHFPKFSQPPFFESPLALPVASDDTSEEETGPVPSDWKKPKIFRVGEDPSAK
ncbi:MAG: hypothetical protein UX12_C0012G0008 [Candidatus Collierbacteria bacterium GW2011_GWC1_45_47]|uniref:Uncharacterized protein n=5 Tax=Candidatus Collieribacteriota TaxID=1752725 RepID=A0A0G1HFG1_9BACT|nr:MAG: hypothetical protein UW23_C0003G0035 [Candidatus Collierbacteria bacterium GW2011_GWA1_44_12]KKT39476.1 MAG: hypothetical protein UW26_C0002G0066 [Candidatus Collierbacteria bacterium GW2011_GWF1_44_12]KKT46076.1 MAG: hypothetical protein UW35_C0023G0008 [Candidatus Collierbacteria bacterium GW2011_GWF2_44_15]KKT99629.1 MAG: hypothetical protein UW99_C0005G0013 [Candidatus Collierbacteria bacterium GW2011_GWC2_45_15]KKU09451.1 MAG: hypothetical protein UX12_C0012G0008 [Candidatus Collie